MRLAPLLKQYGRALSLSPVQHNALHAMTGCRTSQYGHLPSQCEGCEQVEHVSHSCGHRNCPRCLNHCSSLWLDRQLRKLLPCTYFMVTFTLPATLRPLARRHPTIVYDALMDCAASTLKTFAINDNNIGDRIGLTAILHTHSRSKDFHPHVHVIVPGGGLSKDLKRWQSKAGQYLFNGRALSTVFRARMLALLSDKGLSVAKAPQKWIVHCQRVGNGLPALKYLSRYLYRGVIPEKDILSERDGVIRFRYRDNKGKTHICALPADQFIKRILQHVLPKGFRRIRDYGFLSGNARTTLKRVQWALQVVVPPIPERPRPVRLCPHCGGIMQPLSTVKRQRVDDG